MKKLALLLIAAFTVTLLTVSCKKKKDEPAAPQKTYAELIVGRWATADGGHMEVYDAAGTGHMWDPADDVQEDEGTEVEWTLEHNLFTHLYHMEIGGIIPKTYNMKVLDLDVMEYEDDYGVSHKFSKVEELQLLN